MYYLPEIMAYLASCSRKAPVLIHLICVGHVLHTLNQVCHVPRDVSQRRKSGKFHLPCILQPRLEQETVPAKNPLIHQKMGHSTSMLGHPIMSRTSIPFDSPASQLCLRGNSLWTWPELPGAGVKTYHRGGQMQ